jgi:hypothetical protein
MLLLLNQVEQLESKGNGETREEQEPTGSVVIQFEML